EETDLLQTGGGSVLLIQVARTQHQIVRFGALRATANDLTVACQADTQAIDDGTRDRLLRLEHAGRGPVEAGAPELGVVLRVDEPRADADRAARSPETSLEERRDAEVPPYRADVRCRANRERRRARRHANAGQIRERGDELIGHATSKIRVRGVTALAREWQDGERRERGRCACPSRLTKEECGEGNERGGRNDDRRESTDASTAWCAGHAAALKRTGEVAARGKARVWILGEGAIERACQLGRSLGPHAADRRGRAGRDARQRGAKRRSAERRGSGEHLVENRRETEKVAPSIDRAVARRLLRTHVRRRPEQHARLRESLGTGLAQCVRDAKIRHDAVAVEQENVLRLDVAMHDPLTVRVVESVCDVDR